MRSYWDKAVNQRMSRRRALVATGSVTGAAAFLAACGSDSGGSTATGNGNGQTGGQPDTSGMLHTPVDETTNARHGGRHISIQGNALVTHDPHLIGAHTTVIGRTYSQLFRISPGVLEKTSGVPEGDLAEEWELSPDRMTLTIHLEPEAGFAPISPVDGRLVDAEDVVFSWERFKEFGTLAGDLANDRSAEAPITSVEATDARTVTIRMAHPNATIYTLLGLAGLGSYWIVPREAGEDGALDIARTVAGSGPYYLTESTEVNINYQKNPHFKRSKLTNNEPYIESIFEPVITDAAVVSAQFRAGQVYEAVITSTEIVSAKRDLQHVLMYTADPIATERIYFGQNPDSPFVDERMRRAYHKCIDRDLYIQAAYNTDRFADEGLPVTEFWEGSFAANSWTGWTLDPRSRDDYGDLHENFVYSPEEARLLVEAAGYETPFTYPQVQSARTPTSFAPAIYDRKDVWEGMIRDSGVLMPEIIDLEWATEWSPQIRRSGGAFTGASWGPDTSSFDPSYAAFFLYHPSGGYYIGGDNTLTDLAIRIRGEFDDDARMGLVHDLQRYDAEMMFNQKIGVAASFALVWPVVRNVHVFRGSTNWLDIRTGSSLNAWLDESQPPMV